MNTLLFLDVPFDSEEAWEAFSLMHGMVHQKTYETMLARNLVPTFYPLFDFPREANEGYLLDHWDTHKSQADLLGLPDIPDLSTVDLSSETAYQDWLALHAFVHQNEARALGL